MAGAGLPGWQGEAKFAPTMVMTTRVPMLPKFGDIPPILGESSQQGIIKIATALGTISSANPIDLRQVIIPVQFIQNGIGPRVTKKRVKFPRLTADDTDTADGL
jgi:hypothetical protein